MIRFTSRLILLTACVVGLLVTGIGSGGSFRPIIPHALASYCVTNLQGVSNHYWQIENYDFTNSTTMDRCNVDNPINLVFGDNASQQKVQDALYWSYCQSCGSYYRNNQNAYGYGEYVDLNYSPYTRYVRSTTGWKTTVGCGVTDYHVRYYGDFTNYTGYHNALYDPYWGWFVFASSHEDRNDGCPNQQFGWQEDAENEVASDVALTSYVNHLVYQWGNFSNPLSGSSCSGSSGGGYMGDATHCLQSNGYATWISMN